MLLKYENIHNSLSIAINVYYSNLKLFDDKYLLLFKTIMQKVNNKKVSNIKKIVHEYLKKERDLEIIIVDNNNIVFLKKSEIQDEIDIILKENSHLSLNLESKEKNKKIILGLLMKKYPKNIKPQDIIAILNSIDKK